MPHPLKSIANSLPRSFKDMIRNTWIEYIYHDILTTQGYWKTVKISTKAGDFELTIPEDATLPGGISYTDGVHEPGLIVKLDEVLDCTSVFYDIGTRYGYFIGVAVAIGVEYSNIHAFERHAGSFKILESQWGDKVENINNATVGEDSDQLAIDDYTTINNKPDVMKIDVEGSELSVLHSAEETLEEFQPELLIEIHPKELDKKDQSITDICEYLAKFDYTLEYSHHRKNSDEIEWMDVSDSGLAMTTTYLLHGTP